jgi:hypothetical protein
MGLRYPKRTAANKKYERSHPTFGKCACNVLASKLRDGDAVYKRNHVKKLPLMINFKAARFAERIIFGIFLLTAVDSRGATFHYDFNDGVSGWQLGSGWGLESLGPEESVLSVDTQGDSFAWLSGVSLEASWAIDADFRFENLYNDNNSTGTAGIALGGNGFNLLLLADVILSLDRQIYPGVAYYNGQWNNVLSAPAWHPGATNQIHLRLERSPGSNALRFTVKGANGFIRTLSTSPVPDGMWNQITRVGLRGFKSKVRFSSVTIKTPLSPPGASTNDVVSSFDQSADGWNIVELIDTFGAGPYTNIHRGPWPPVYVNEGNPGGCLRFLDNPGDSFFMAAPSKFLGNVLACYGLALSFELKAGIVPPGAWYNEADLILTGADGLVLVNSLGIVPTTTWNGYQVPMTETAWRVGKLGGRQPSQAEFRGVLSDLKSLWIRGEYFYGNDVILFDNVRLAMSFVPLPSLSIRLGNKIEVIQHLVVGYKYALDASPDLVTWTEMQPSFTATNVNATNEFSISAAAQFFRIRRVP